MAKKSESSVKSLEAPENVVKVNHEFLFIYDAKLCNPNGDPGNENKPRMDEDRDVNLCSDVRLKRFIRDYLQKNKKKKIYVTKIEGKPVEPKEVLKKLKEEKDELEFKDDSNIAEFYLKNLIDVRMFGATMAIEKEQMAFTGPIQINWGYSLHKVSLCNSYGITTTFKSSEQATQSSMGEDWRVNYSLIAFYGNIIAHKAWNEVQKNGTLLTTDDIKLFDEAIVKSIPLFATRSKIGQYPRFYLRLAYTNNEYIYGDLRSLVKFKIKPSVEENVIKEENIRNVSEIILDVSRLQKLIDELKEKEMLDRDNSCFYKDLNLETIPEISF